MLYVVWLRESTVCLRISCRAQVHRRDPLGCAGLPLGLGSLLEDGQSLSISLGTVSRASEEERTGCNKLIRRPDVVLFEKSLATQDQAVHGRIKSDFDPAPSFRLSMPLKALLATHRAGMSCTRGSRTLRVQYFAAPGVDSIKFNLVFVHVELTLSFHTGVYAHSRFSVDRTGCDRLAWSDAVLIIAACPG